MYNNTGPYPTIQMQTDNNERYDPYNIRQCEDDIEEEQDAYRLNLGAETPRSIMSDDLSFQDAPMSRAGIAANTGVPTRKRSWRSLSFVRKSPTLRHSKNCQELDCGICFEPAAIPCRALCCGKLFCLEHLTDWLHGSSSDGRCPSCKSPCSLELVSNAAISSGTRRAPPSPPPTRASHRSSPSIDSTASDTSSESEVDGTTSDDEAMQTWSVETRDPADLSEDALSRIMGKVLSIVALMVFFHAILPQQ
ncbi:hypothetical protein CYLTODRAFT_418833 [Cylindrobasidium torrendii FP15055 ss-10]|uniref:RING-type domain-containing protein n=1 Tax=Cylindrobasidium torrendii FP15055 ss-10 TaxID=1314674 RepID=A0A0D7BMQ2_9AGAR|nr:hypothetical protein CYLTODRAFT_418833 [Cylindrobasidium torrendii FP15055 ss-10]